MKHRGRLELSSQVKVEMQELRWLPFLSGAALLKLRDDIQTCGYEDVQVMWEMLRRTESELITHRPKRKPRPFWRIFVWHRHNAASSFSLNQD
ncbi:hypothetical protein RJ640_021416 [Escallonia rubra]|uniref:Uncharacterized protein n=1 Tax=Escallonia rubra TaxID=112253 RepID=A0AA88R242_9ASTE|nr:hypothetical protein RJ640_021416 [Escallonia rubra]